VRTFLGAGPIDCGDGGGSGAEATGVIEDVGEMRRHPRVAEPARRREGETRGKEAGEGETVAEAEGAWEGTVKRHSQGNPACVQGACEPFSTADATVCNNPILNSPLCPLLPSPQSPFPYSWPRTQDRPVEHSANQLGRIAAECGAHHALHVGSALGCRGQ